VERLGPACRERGGSDVGPGAAFSGRRPERDGSSEGEGGVNLGDSGPDTRGSGQVCCGITMATNGKYYAVRDAGTPSRLGRVHQTYPYTLTGLEDALEDRPFPQLRRETGRGRRAGQPA
jgi:hypothetical protein